MIEYEALHAMNGVPGVPEGSTKFLYLFISEKLVRKKKMKSHFHLLLTASEYRTMSMCRENTTRPILHDVEQLPDPVSPQGTLSYMSEMFSLLQNS